MKDLKNSEALENNKRSKDLYKTLKQLDIGYEEIEHEAVYTVEEAKRIDGKLDGTGCKALFLRRKNRYYLALLKEGERADLKKIAAAAGTSQLSFASPERLMEVLGLEPGSVTPLGIINDRENKTVLILDKGLKGGRLLLHPNVNTRTLSMSYDDLIKFIEHEKHSYIEI